MVTAALISDTLTSIGAVGGILSIVGTGLLILLVASQSRQIRAMREWIEQEPQRQQETAQRVIAEVQRRIAAARERRNPADGAASVDPLAGSKVKPAPGTLGATPEAQAIAAQAAGLHAAPPADYGTAVMQPSPLAPGIEPPRFAPLTPAGEAGAVDMDEPAIVTEILGQDTQLADALPDPDFTGATAAAASSGVDERFSDEQFDLEEEDRPRSNRLLFGGGIALVLAGIIFAATQLFGGSGSGSADKSRADTANPGSGGGPKTATTPKKATASAPARSSVSVLVFNATTVSGLGKTNSDALKTKGYGLVGPPQTWSPSLTTASVMYRAGYKSGAAEVAKDLGLSGSVVTPIDENTSVKAGQAAKVVVKAVGQPAGSAASTTG